MVEWLPSSEFRRIEDLATWLESQTPEELNQWLERIQASIRLDIFYDPLYQEQEAKVLHEKEAACILAYGCDLIQLYEYLKPVRIGSRCHVNLFST